MRTAAAAAILLLVTACTSSAGAPPQPPHSPPGPPHQVTTRPPSPTATPAVTDGKGAKIGVVLPDRSVRWRVGEPAAVHAACTAVRLDCVIENAGGSSAEMATLAADLQTAGIRILVLVPIDQPIAATIERTARRAGVLTIEYDQHVLRGSAAAFVRPDTSETGRLLARGLTRCPQVAHGVVPYARVDPPAGRVGGTAQSHAYRRVLRGAPGWSLVAAATARDASTARAGVAPILRNARGVRAVLTTSDSTAAGVITALRRRAGRVAVSGNGATVLGLQHVLAGTQCFTIYHPPADGAQALAATLVRLVNFEPVVSSHSVAAARGRRTAVVEYGGAQLIRKADVKVVIDGGYADRALVCTSAYAADCAAAGI